MIQTVRHPTSWCGLLAPVVVALVTWALAATQVQAIESVDELAVVDGTGKKIGKLIDTGAEKDFVDVVFQAAPNVFVKLFVLRDGLDSSDDVAFESSDCTGVPYLPVDSGDPRGRSLFAAADVAPPGHTLYVEDKDATARTVTFGSTFSSFDGCQSFGFTAEAVPAVKMADLDTLFTPPFRLVASPGQAASCCGDCNADGTVAINEIITSVTYALNQCPTP